MLAIVKLPDHQKRLYANMQNILHHTTEYIEQKSNMAKSELTFDKLEVPIASGSYTGKAPSVLLILVFITYASFFFKKIGLGLNLGLHI